MVVDYSNIFDGVQEQIPQQDWSDESWSAISDDDSDSVRVFRDPWGEEAGGIHYHAYGQGEDPEQAPILFELVLGEDVDSPEAIQSSLSERLEGDMKELIGWTRPDDERVFMRKELPSDPLTLLPRLLEEFKKLEVVSNRVDEVLDTTTESAR
jgi:hypothetical protein